MKILYLVPFGGTGGAEKIAIDLAKKFSKKHDVKIIFLRDPLLADVNGLNVSVLGLNNFKSIFKALFKFYLEIKMFKPDIVHSHLFYANFLARLFKIIFNYKLLCSEHNTITPYTNFPVYFKILTRFTNKLSNFNSNVSLEAVNSFVDNGYYNYKNLHCVYNGFDFKRFFESYNNKDKFNLNKLGIKNNKHWKFLAVGRLHYQKNWPMMFQALSMFKNYDSNFILYIVGDGEDLVKLKEIIVDLELEENICFLGIRKDVDKLMAVCDLFLLSSFFEGLPTVLIEAMASRLNIVSTDCGGVTEILGSSIYVVKNNDTESFCKAIIESLNVDNSALIETRYNRAIEVFSNTKMYNKWENIYESV